MDVSGEILVRYKGKAKRIRYEIGIHHPYPYVVHMNLFDKRGWRIPFDWQPSRNTWICGLNKITMPDDYREILYAEMTKAHFAVLARIVQIAADQPKPVA